jgi:outer membrane protein OmpA-like peptidoglycan-associated protein
MTRVLNDRCSRANQLARLEDRQETKQRKAEQKQKRGGGPAKSFTQDRYVRTTSSFGGLQVTRHGAAKLIPQGELQVFGSASSPSKSPASECSLKKADAQAKAARSRVAHPKDGLGFGFGSAKLDRAQLKKWLAANLAKDNHALLNPENEIVLIAGASSTGSKAANQRLAQQRAKAVASFLKSELGLHSARVRVEIKLAAPGSAERAEDRTVRIQTRPLAMQAKPVQPSPAADLFELPQCKAD